METKKRNHISFDQGLQAWLATQEKAHRDAIDILTRHGDIDVQEDLGIHEPYFFISVEKSVYMQELQLRKDAVIVLASDNLDDIKYPISLSWEDVCQDVPILNDLMSALYEFDERGDTSERISSFDVCFSPIVNVQMCVKDPYNLSDNEMDTLVEKAKKKVLQYADEKLSGENLESVSLYEFDVKDGPLDKPISIY